MAIAYFKHTPVGKSTQAQPYTTAAHARYIMRSRAASVVRSHNMPRQYHAVQRYLSEQEDSIRKNGRVADKFIIAIPREFTPEQAEKILYRYGCRIGQGKAPFLFAFHWEEQNPHAHMIFIDRDPETGKRIFGTSNQHSTQNLKLVWESEVNTLFNELGSEQRIDFVADQTNVLERDPVQEPHVAQTADIPAVPAEKRDKEVELTISEDAREGEQPVADEEVDDPKEDMEYILERTDRVRAAVEYKRELQSLKTTLAKLEQAQESYRAASASHEKHVAASGEALNRKKHLEERIFNAEQALKSVSREDGRLKGFGIEIFGKKLGTRSWRTGKEAIETIAYSDTQLDLAKKDLAQAEKDAAYWANVGQEYEAAAAKAQDDINAITMSFGDRTTVEDAERILTFNMHTNLSNVEAKDLRQMMLDGIIAEGEYLEALEILGTQEAQEYAREYQDIKEQEHEEGLEQ